MTKQALVPTERADVGLASAVDHFAALHHMKSAIMQLDVDYGTIRGCGSKPALLKPGAEKVLRRFMVHTSPEDTTIEDLSVGGEMRYRIMLGGRTPDGVVRGFGIGECSTAEEKYAWRKAVCKAEYDDTPDPRRRIKYYQDGVALQVRANPADQANTVLKMAKKRALVDLALTSCAASQFFTQDVEDLPAELRGEIIDIPLATEQPEPESRAPHPSPREQPAPDPERPPDEWPTKKRVFWYMRRLDLSPEAVTAAAAACQAPENADDWSDFDGQSIIGLLHKAPPEPTNAPPAAVWPPPAAAHRTRRSRCKVCKELFYPAQLVGGQCEKCREAIGTAPTGKPCKACRKHTPLENLDPAGTCPVCTPPEVPAGGSPMDTQLPSGKPDMTCQRCKAGPFWPAQMTFVGEHGLVCGQCVVVLGLTNTRPERFACLGGCGETVTTEGGKCQPCALAGATPPGRPGRP